MNSGVKKWILLKTFIFKYAFWREGKSRCIWRKIKTIKRYNSLISRLCFKNTWKKNIKKAGSVNLFQKGQLCLYFQVSYLKMFKSIHCCKKLRSIVSHEVLFIWLTTVAVTLTLSLKWKSVWRRLSVKTCIMLKPVNWLSLNVKWVASTWHKASLKGAFEKTLKSLKMLKFVKNTLKFLKCC